MRAARPAFVGWTLAALCCAMPPVTAADGATDRVALLAQAGAEDDADEFVSLSLRGGALY
jgi:hypothetical protein